MHAFTTVIAVPRQNAKMENAFVKERQLETGNTAEVWLIIKPDLMYNIYYLFCNRLYFIMTL